jgi:hypothetical protein
MQIEPEKKIVQADFGRQARLKAGQVVRTLTRQAKGIQEFVVDGLDDLSQAGQPAPQGFGPVDALTALVRRRHQVDLKLGLPAAARSFSGKAFVCHVGALSRQVSTGQMRRGVLTSGEQGRRQLLIMGTGRLKAKTSDDAQRRDTQQQMKAFIPAEAIAPADICLPSQPAGATAFGIAGHCRGTIQDFIAALLGLQVVNEKQAERCDRIAMLAQEPIELPASRQCRKRGSQLLLHVAVKGPFTGELHPLPKEGQRDHLTAMQGRPWPWGMLAPRQTRLAKIIGHDVQCSQEGIQIDLKLAPFLGNWFDKLTVISGYLAFQLLSISHQTYIGIAANPPFAFTGCTRTSLMRRSIRGLPGP